MEYRAYGASMSPVVHNKLDNILIWQNSEETPHMSERDPIVVLTAKIAPVVRFSEGQSRIKKPLHWLDRPLDWTLK